MPTEATALIVGASRGLGLALVEEWLDRGLRVIATVRNPSPPLQDLAERYATRLAIETVDIADARSVIALRQRLNGRKLDVLFVNAGICIAREDTPATADERDFLAMMVTNALSPVRVVENFDDLVNPGGVIAVMTSELGSIANSKGFWELYSSSKAALNMLMKCYAARNPENSRAMLLVAPGWVRTEMGGHAAPFSIEQSIPHVVDTVTKSAGHPGLRFVDRFGNELPW
jgi:NAD(P)-dependent dehydrogenase (short-subunit alcohol dehydrogenase family)